MNQVSFNKQMETITSIKEQLESLIQVLYRQKDYLFLGSQDTECVDRAIEIAVDLKNRCGDIV